MLRIGYFGDGPWASLAIKHIVEQSDKFEIVFITPRDDKRDPDLKIWADKLGVPFLPFANVNDPESLSQIKEFNCDLLVSMSFNQILRKDIIALAPQGFINCHAGALPFYRGRNPLNWALINGESAFGVTVHYVDEGIDTGDIITQNMVEITQEDDYAALLEKAHSACADTLLEALEAVAGGNPPRKKQDEIHKIGTYFGMRRIGDENIDFTNTSQELHNFIRAINVPGPGARAMSEKGEVALLKSEVIADAPIYKATIGEVVGRNEKGIILKTADTTLVICEVAFVKEDGSLEKPFVPRWRIGTRLWAK